MSRIHKEHLQAGYIFGDTINQEYIYLPSGEVGTDHPWRSSKHRLSVKILPWTKLST